MRRPVRLCAECHGQGYLLFGSDSDELSSQPCAACDQRGYQYTGEFPELSKADIVMLAVVGGAIVTVVVIRLLGY